MNDLVAKIDSASSSLKTLLSVPAVAGSGEAQGIVSDVQRQLEGIQARLAELTSESDALRDKLRQVASPPEVVVNDGKYFSRDGDGPFCTGCFDLQRTLIRLHAMPAEMRNLGKWRCPVCSTHYH